MKVLILNGSPHENGCTYAAISEITKTLQEEGVESNVIWLGNREIRDCVGCMGCKKVGKCVFDDDIVNEIHDMAESFDGFIFASPVYYAHPTARLMAVLNRLFFQGSKPFWHKPAAAVLSARRAGECTGFDAINKYFTISQMPIVSSSYWNNVHGIRPDDVSADAEGLQTMRNLARNMAWMLKCIEAGKKAGIDVPQYEPQARTNFIR